MIVEFREEFDNDLSKLDKKLINRIFTKINLFKEKGKISEISWIKKLSWFDNCYRIRIWDYRLWFSYQDWKIILERFLHRKEIYRYYPK